MNFARSLLFKSSNNNYYVLTEKKKLLLIFVKQISPVHPYISVYNKDNILIDLYNALEELRYPEVAQIDIKEFEVTILTGNKRIDLLYWILQENKNFNCNLLNKFKESSLEGKLFKCYSQMGFCSSEDVLLGKCKIDEQLHFLSSLALFIRRTHSVESESLKYDKEAANTKLKADVVNFSLNSQCSGNDSNDTNKNGTSLHNDSKSLESSCSFIDKQRMDFENMFSNIKLNLEQSNKHQSDNYEPTLQKFYTSFKNVKNLPAQNSNKSSQYCHDFNTDIEQIHTAFSTINKAMVNEVEFNNRLEPENSEKTAKSLSSVISDNVVLIEQACNTLKENQAISYNDKL